MLLLTTCGLSAPSGVSHLISSHLISSHLISSHLISSQLSSLISHRLSLISLSLDPTNTAQHIGLALWESPHYPLHTQKELARSGSKVSFSSSLIRHGCLSPLDSTHSPPSSCRLRLSPPRAAITASGKPEPSTHSCCPTEPRNSSPSASHQQLCPRQSAARLPGSIISVAG